MNTDKTQLITSSSVSIGAPSVANALFPIARVASPLSFRLATLQDVAAMDALQKQYNKSLGYFKTEWFKGYIKTGGILLAECDGRLVGYCISRDRYLKRDELGIIHQLCVAPGQQRKLIGAELVREVFARSAYGCKLYCCWCAQDIDANHFWESIGFLPIAFRAGSEKKRRVHIFWQKRIREGDTTTPWWFPSETTGGAIGEGRIVLPIPPGTHWSDAKPIVLPGAEQKQLAEAPRERKSVKRPVLPKLDKQDIAMGGLRPLPVKPPTAEAAAKPKREPRPKRKNDPQFVAKARELRDRYLEHVNGGQLVLESAGKYDVSRALPAPASSAAHDAPVAILSTSQPKQLPHPLPTAA